MATESHGAGGHSPLEQFRINRLLDGQVGGVDVSFTNSSLMMVIAVALISIFLTVGMSRRAMVPGRLQSMAELAYEFIANMVRDNIGSEGRRYFPLVFSLFMFVLLGNVLGMIPFSFTFTSHLIVTFTLAISVFVFVTVLGFARHGIRFLGFFAPPGTPLVLWPLMIPIEIISYLSRPVSLAFRLFANMTAGHTLLKVFAGFVGALGLMGVVPLAVIVGLTGLELLIAFLQAYIFTILTCIYIHDALHMH